MPPSPSPSPPPAKSCLKRNSFSGTPTGTRALFLDGAAPSARARAASVSTSPVFYTDSDTASDHSSSSNSESPPSFADYGYGPAPRTRRKSVSFCEEDDVRVFYPVTDPLCKQARKQVVRIFRACAEALRIDSPYSPPASRRGSISSVEEEDEDEEEF
ncbi:hypothetical protein C8Q73DRAFT_791143 [Cubamyces lactineus]|nr:hypothetical protein C8Q73DRAFT_791143 [Cubamyces lactineus]